jgi:uncharacterized protein involved in exopolysaccharide biosynthesis
MENKEPDNLYPLLVNYLSSRKKLIALITFSAIVLGIGYTYIAPHSYTATTTILPPLEKSGGGGLTALMSSVGSSVPFGGLLGGSGSSTEYYLDILSSRRLTKKVYEELDIENHNLFEDIPEEYIIKILQNSLEADFELSGIITMDYKLSTNFFPDSSDKAEVALLSSQIANEYINQLDEFLINRDKQKAIDTRIYIDSELNKYKAQVDSLALMLEEFQNQNKLLSLDEQTQATITQAIGISQELAIANTELNLARITFSDDSQEIKALESKVEMLERQYSAAQSGGISSSDQFSLPLNNLPNLARRYAVLYRDREVLEQVILFLETQKHQEAIQETKDVAQIDVLDYAEVPIKRTSPSRLITAAASGLIVFTLTIAGLLFIAYREGKRSSNSIVE